MEAEATSMSGEAPAATAPRLTLPVSAAVAVQGALAAAGFGVCVVWAWHDGGFAPDQWLPGGLLLLALLCTAGASADFRSRLLARPLPLVLFGLYVGWSYVSILWAQVPADALDGANRTLVYWLVFALFSGLALSERLGESLVLAWGTAVAVLGTLAFAQAATATSAAGHFVEGRLAAPISYPDGDAALFLSAGLALVVLASRRQAHTAFRITACIAAVVLADLSVLCQSRASLVWLPCAVVLYLAVARNRLRAVAHLAVVAAAVAPAMPALLHVYSAVVAVPERQGTVTRAAAWIVGSAVLAVLGMLVLLLLERHVSFSERARVLIGGTLSAVLAATVLTAVVIAAGSHPLARADRAWHDFTTNKAAAVSASPHFSSGLGTSRYDVWRIAVRQFLDHPLTGVGADNFLVGYLHQRRTHETSRYPSSVELRTFSETGIVGATLFLGFLALAFWRAARAARRSRSPGLALACFVACGYWLFHSSTDWFWELPALTGAALALLAIAAASDRVESSPTRQAAIGRLKIAAAAGMVLVAAAAFAIPWASVSLIDAAVARGPGAGAYSLLNTAASLNPWSEQPALAEATLAANAGDRALERRALLKASRRNPYDWYPHLMLGIVAGREHHDAVARAELARAHKISPEDLVVSWAQTRLRWGLPLTERQVGRLLPGGLSSNVPGGRGR
jgi:O-antigen ligase